MELKCGFNNISNVGHKCLNRTFMELKFAQLYVYTLIQLFKSHLYGIEISNATSTERFSNI